MSASFFFPDKSLLFPTQDDYLETARYLGYKKSNPPDETISSLIKKSVDELFNNIQPKATYESFSLTLEPQSNNISFADFSIISTDLSRNLNNCKKIYILATTIGPLVDAAIRKTGFTDTVKSGIFQAAGAMYIEKLVDLVNSRINEEVQKENLHTRPRYSPGYGDVSLDIQKKFFQILPCAKIGLTLMDSLIMAPEKSVTAFIGVY